MTAKSIILALVMSAMMAIGVSAAPPADNAAGTSMNLSDVTITSFTYADEVEFDGMMIVASAAATSTLVCTGESVAGVICQEDIDAMQNGILAVVGLVIRLGVSLFLAFSPLAGIKGGFAFAGSLLRGVVAAVSNFRI
jgi:hypothetical protein